MSNCELFEADTPSRQRGRRKSNVSYGSKAWNMAGMANRTTMPVIGAVIIMGMRCGGNLDAQKSGKEAQGQRASPC